VDIAAARDHPGEGAQERGLARPVGAENDHDFPLVDLEIDTAALHRFVWWRLIRMLQVRHRWSWKDVRRHFTIPTGRWLPIGAAVNGQRDFPVGGQLISLLADRLSPCPRTADLLLI